MAPHEFISFSRPEARYLVELLAMLVMGHFVADFALQSDRMAVEKCAGQDHTLSWKWWLTSHAAIHGFFVAAITGVVWLGLAEWGIHMLIDHGKCRLGYSLLLDQSLHLVCKILWVSIVISLGLSSASPFVS